MTRTRALPPGLIDGAAEVVRRRTGLAFGPSRMGAFEAGFTKALAGTGATPDGFIARLDHDAAALDDLVAEITVGETYFFREPEQCAVIRDRILPALLAHRQPNQSLRMWSAGCATGEEAYTLALLLRAVDSAPAHIVGTDLSRAALARARRGQYTRWSMRGVEDAVVETWFRRESNRFVLSPDIREAVEFQYLNLAEDVYPSLFSGIWGMDLILCRNVLIYFDSETIARVARRLIDSLSANGWLILGSSDPMLTDIVPCEVVLTSAGLAYRPPGTSTPDSAFPRQFASSPPVEATQFPLPIKEWADGGWTEPAPLAAQSSPNVPTESEKPPVDAAVSFRERDYERAADLAAQGTQHDADALPLWIVWVRALANLGRLEEAGRACVAGLERHQTSAELTYLHAVLLTEMSHFEAAARAAQRALYLDRSLVVAHLTLARALTRLGDNTGARRSLQNATRLLDAVAPDVVLPASDGEPAGRLAEVARVHLALLGAEAA